MESSMIEVYFVVDGEVVPWKRPRFNGHTKHVFEDAKVKAYKDKVRAAYLDEAQYQPMRWEKDIPISVTVNIYFEIPKSASKKAKSEYLLNKRPTKRPDNDNLYKGITDALNGIAYYDDSQIVETIIRKFWSEEPKAEVTIRSVTA